MVSDLLNMKFVLQKVWGRWYIESLGDWFFTTTGADAPGAQHREKPVLVIIFLENTRECPEIITSTGAEFWLPFCLSALVLVIF